MTARRSGKTARRYKKKNQSGAWLAGVVLGVSLAVTWGSIRAAIQSVTAEQLFSAESIYLEDFASSNYQPIQIGNNNNQNIRRDWEQIDRLAQQLDYQGNSTTELASLLSQHVTTEAEKARIIYAWITQHIAYDLVAFDNAVNYNRYPDVSPAIVLRDRSTICSGYSNLYFALAKAMNLDVAIVIGYAKRATPNQPRFQDVNHAWNAVQIDSAWYLLDATWGAGSIVENQFTPDYKPYYFATPPEEFIQNHFPQDLGWQLLDQTYTRAEFDNLPQVSDRFYNLGLQLSSHDNYRIDVSNRFTLKLKAPKDIAALAVLKQGEQEFANAAIVNRQGNDLIINIAPPAAGSYELGIYAKKQNDSGQYGEVVQYQLEAHQSSAGLAKIYGHFNQQQANLIEPLDVNLQSNRSTYFNLVVPQATDVRVVNTTTESSTPLRGYGNSFVGHVNIDVGDTIVVARFPGSNEYWKLIEYQSVP